MEEVLVRLAGRRELDDLALLPRVADLHREALERRARRQRDAEAPLERARLGVVEREAELGERERSVDDRLRLQRGEPQAATVGGGQCERRLADRQSHAGRRGGGARSHGRPVGDGPRRRGSG